MLKSKKFDCEIRIECKWQQSNGSVDEKFPYLYLNCIEAMPEKEIVIIVDGGGAKVGAITWLQETVKSKKYTSDYNNDKIIHVFSLAEFIKWANIRFRWFVQHPLQRWHCFLKTIFPSRKYTAKYLGSKGEENE